MDFDMQQGVMVLVHTPRTLVTLREMLLGLPSAWIEATEGTETCRPDVIVGHLNHGERTDWIQRAEIVRAQGVN